mmetsp:Transcript_50784/g.147934  ORF Transcript_50784/g.147934 Transcript_50784/m.147934 type:complete len:251 (-) Transcript_50784:71-823(-)
MLACCWCPADWEEEGPMPAQAWDERSAALADTPVDTGRPRWQTHPPLPAHAAARLTPRTSVASLQSRPFEVPLARPELRCSWGLLIDEPTDGAIYIARVMDDGPVQEYNLRAPEGQRIERDDIITSVDGLTDASAMLRALRTQTSVTIELSRPTVFDVCIPLVGGQLGVVLDHRASGLTLTVGGVVPDGAANRSSADIAVGDRIVAVNGRRGAACDLLHELKAREAPQLTIARWHGAAAPLQLAPANVGS